MTQDGFNRTLETSDFNHLMTQTLQSLYAFHYKLGRDDII